MKIVSTIILISVLVDHSTTTLSKQDRGKKNKKDNVKQVITSKRNVIDRDLVNDVITSTDIINEHMSYSDAEREIKHFAGTTLAYVTPWNNHGYDIAKIFGHKFSFVSPVWLQVKREPSGSCVIEGGHDIDEGWIKDVKQVRSVEIVPRLLFDSWSIKDYQQLFSSEETMLSCIKTILKFITSKKFAGVVVELWSQLAGHKKDDMLHFLIHFGETFQKQKKKFILVLPPPSFDEQRPSIVTQADFEMVLPFVDYVSLMTYDYSGALRRPGPNSPVEWMQRCVETLSPEAGAHRHKILLGLNFYGNHYSASDSGPIVGSQFLQLIGKQSTRVELDSKTMEHIFSFKIGETRHVVFYPTLYSLHVRLQLAEKLGVGISIWEVGQGLDYFYDLL